MSASGPSAAVPCRTGEEKLSRFLLCGACYPQVGGVLLDGEERVALRFAFVVGVLVVLVRVVVSEHDGACGVERSQSGGYGHPKTDSPLNARRPPERASHGDCSGSHEPRYRKRTCRVGGRGHVPSGHLGAPPASCQTHSSAAPGGSTGPTRPEASERRRVALGVRSANADRS